MGTYYAINTSSNILCHSGIKGMKWGRRRYQNEDGSLTPAGRERYGALQSRVKEHESNSIAIRQKLQKARSDPKYRIKAEKWQRKKDEAQAKRDKYTPLAQRGINKRFIYDKNPSSREQRAMSKLYKYNLKIAKYEKKINRATKAVSKLEIQSAKSDKKYISAKKALQKYETKYGLNLDQRKANEERMRERMRRKISEDYDIVDIKQQNRLLDDMTASQKKRR